jgi:basic membrane protein A
MLSGCGGWMGRAPERGPIVALLPGNVATDPYSKAAQRGLLRIEKELGIPVQVLAPADDSAQALREALRSAATSDATLLIAAGDEPHKLLLQAAQEYPDQRFAVIDTDTQSAQANVVTYDLLTEQGAWLAGAAAGLLTRTNVVGYASGAQGQAWQQAFTDGLAASNGQAHLIARSDNGSAGEWAGAVRAATEAQADVVYLAGDDAPYSAYAAAREQKIALIADRHERGPLTSPLVAAVITDPGEAVFQAGRDLYDAMWKGGTVRRLGVNAPNAVGLVLARSVPQAVHEQLEIYRKQLTVSTASARKDGGPAARRNGSL